MATSVSDLSYYIDLLDSYTFVADNYSGEEDSSEPLVTAYNFYGTDGADVISTNDVAALHPSRDAYRLYGYGGNDILGSWIVNRKAAEVLNGGDGHDFMFGASLGTSDPFASVIFVGGVGTDFAGFPGGTVTNIARDNEISTTFTVTSDLDGSVLPVTVFDDVEAVAIPGEYGYEDGLAYLTEDLANGRIRLVNNDELIYRTTGDNADWWAKGLDTYSDYHDFTPEPILEPETTPEPELTQEPEPEPTPKPESAHTSFQLARVKGFSNNNLIRDEVAYNGKLYFTAAADKGTQIYEDGQTHGAIIWETDGTKEGTMVLHDFAPGPTKFIPTSLKVANDHLFFEVRIDENEGGRYELWSYKTGKDLTDHELTRLISSIDDARNMSRSEVRETTRNGLFFLRRYTDPTKTELWFSNGKPGAENTYALGGNVRGEPLSSFVDLVGGDNLLYFISDGTESVPGRDEPRWDPNELWSTTSQPGTFSKLSDFDYSPDRGSPINGKTTIGDALYFTGPTLVETVGAYPGYNFDLEPWVSKGSNQTTQQIDDINPDLNSANLPLGTQSRNFTLFKGEIFFLGYVHRRTSEEDPAETLYAYNPVSGNVREVAQTAEKWSNHFYRELFVFNDYLYFSGQTEETGWELWRSDGTSRGTGLLKDIKSNGNSSSHPQGFAIHKKDRALYSAEDDDLYFHTEDGKLWKLAGDSSLIEEVEVNDTGWVGAGNITPVEIENGATDLYFTSGLALYKLDEATPDTPTPEREPQPEPKPYDGIIQSVRGKGKLKGTKGADAFTFDSFDVFTKKAADKIIGFNALEGDTITVSQYAFPALKDSAEINFASTNKKKKLKQLSKQDYDFVYYEKKGRLYFDGNGPDKNWGDSNEGGLVAILKGKPDLTVDDFTLLA